MKTITSRRSILSLFLLLLSWHIQALVLNNPKTALADYIAYDDGMYQIQYLTAVPGSGYTAHVYSMTSQQWLTTAEVNNPVWKHTLVMIVPTTVNSTTAMLYVGGGRNTDAIPGLTDQTVQVISQIALSSQSIVSAVFQTPNQPLIFSGETVNSDEDVLVSYTWKKAMDTGNYQWPAYLPMTKSVIKAMDGIQSAANDLGYTINDFVLTGYSKRGAAVWLTAAVDSRVKAIAPGVIDFLNTVNSFEHQYKSYGSYSLAVESYIKRGITDKIRSPEYADLSQIIDPYNYLAALTMPKFILNSSGDEFFLPDSSRYYYDDLIGEKHIRFAPNTGHSLSNSKTSVYDTLYSLLGWYQTILYNMPRPEINWQLNNGVLSASTSITPVAVRSWSANNPAARDFRHAVIGEVWTASTLQADANGKYSVTLTNGGAGYTATFIEFVYNGLANVPLTYSTQVYVTPDTEPFALSNPLLDPKTALFWNKQVKNAQVGITGDVSADTLKNYLPIPLFDQYMNNLEDMNAAFRIGRTTPITDLAKRECLATRLNISHGEFGWYSTVDLGWGLGSKLLWEHYKTADDAANVSFPWLSALICAKLNML